MKRVLFLLTTLLALTACVPAPLELVPVETLVAQTMAAMPKSATPVFTATATYTITPNVSPTPEIDLSAVGAQCVPLTSERTKALVTRVLSGDTVEAVIGEQLFKVRYIGIQAPVPLPPFEWQGPQALAANERLVMGQVVILVKDQSDTTADGALLRYVFIGNVFANYEIVRQGYARVVSMPPDSACDGSLLTAQAEAQAAMFGIWIATPSPTNTMTFTPTMTSIPTITRTPTATSIPVCDCTGPKLTCNNFTTQQQAQACFEYCKEQGYGDIFNMDKNNNGIACEGMK